MTVPSEQIELLGQVLERELTRREAIGLLELARAWDRRRPDMVRLALAAGVSKSEIARQLGITRNTVYELLKTPRETPETVS